MGFKLPKGLIYLNLTLAVAGCGAAASRVADVAPVKPGDASDPGVQDNPFTAWSGRSDIEGPFPAVLSASWLKGGKRQLSYFNVDGRAVTEGDILLKPGRDGAQTGALGFGIKTQASRWPGGIVPYVITSGMSNEAEIKQAIAHWHAKTRVRFVPRTSETDYLVFKTGTSNCWSYVGRTGGEQEVSLSPQCGMPAIAHEMGHAVGLMHEQSRPDRDQYITIFWDNIDPTFHSQFDLEGGDAIALGAYDITSVMHYPSSAFSKDGKPALLTKAGGTIPYMTGLSQGDVDAVASLYAGIIPDEPQVANANLSFVAALLVAYTPPGSSCTYQVVDTSAPDAHGRIVATLKIEGVALAEQQIVTLNRTFDATTNGAILAAVLGRAPLHQCLQP